jgi:hypothetical protein
MVRKLITVATAMVLASIVVSAQTTPASPDGRAQVQVGYTAGDGAYKSGKWVEITYSRPILRGRDMFANDAKLIKADGAKIWRAGANVSTRLRTEVPLMIAGKTVPAGEYSVFIDLKGNAWTFVLSSWPQQTKYDPNNKAALWGSFGYTPDKDVVRAPMTLAKNAMSVEELTWNFANVTAAGGDLVIMWDKEIASVPFTVAK